MNVKIINIFFHKYFNPQYRTDTVKTMDYTTTFSNQTNVTTDTNSQLDFPLNSALSSMTSSNIPVTTLVFTSNMVKIPNINYSNMNIPPPLVPINVNVSSSVSSEIPTLLNMRCPNINQSVVSVIPVEIGTTSSNVSFIQPFSSQSTVQLMPFENPTGSATNPSGGGFNMGSLNQSFQIPGAGPNPGSSLQFFSMAPMAQFMGK